jgi:hypothetical protein
MEVAVYPAMNRSLGALLALAVATSSGCAAQGGARLPLGHRGTTTLMLLAGLAAAAYGVAEIHAGKNHEPTQVLDFGGEIRETVGWVLLTGGAGLLVGGAFRLIEGERPPRVRLHGARAAAPWPIQMRASATPSRPLASR